MLELLHLYPASLKVSLTVGIKRKTVIVFYPSGLCREKIPVLMSPLYPHDSHNNSCMCRLSDRHNSSTCPYGLYGRSLPFRSFLPLFYDSWCMQAFLLPFFLIGTACPCREIRCSCDSQGKPCPLIMNNRQAAVITGESDYLPP